MTFIQLWYLDLIDVCRAVANQVTNSCLWIKPLQAVCLFEGVCCHGKSFACVCTEVLLRRLLRIEKLIGGLPLVDVLWRSVVEVNCGF